MTPCQTLTLQECRHFREHRNRRNESGRIEWHPTGEPSVVEEKKVDFVVFEGISHASGKDHDRRLKIREALSALEAIYLPCIYSHARWRYRRRFRSLLLCPLSVERYYFPLHVDSTLGRKGGNWLRNHQWCSNDPRG